MEYNCNLPETELKQFEFSPDIIKFDTNDKLSFNFAFYKIPFLLLIFLLDPHQKVKKKQIPGLKVCPICLKLHRIGLKNAQQIALIKVY